MIELIQRGPRFWKYRFLWWLTENFNYTPKAPLHVDIELTNQCNLACTMCPHGDENWQPEKGMMSKVTAKNIIDQCATLGVFSVKLQFRGESALHKDLPEIVKYAKDKGIMEVQLNTNGIPFTDIKVMKLVRDGLDRLIVSVDGATKETYAKIRVGGQLSQVKKTLGLFRHAKTIQVSKTPYIRIQMTQQDSNDDEVKEFKRLFEPYADELIVKPVRSRNTGERRSCPQPRQRLVAGWNGIVYGCCNAWNEESKIDYWPPDDTRFPTTRGHQVEFLISRTWEHKAGWLREKAKHPEQGEPCKSCQVRSSYK